MFSPLTQLILFTIVTTALLCFRALAGIEISQGLDVFRIIIAKLLLVHWVRVDSRNTHYWPCFHYDLYLMAVWPVVLLQYLVHTRGARGLAAFVGLASLLLIPACGVTIIRDVTHALQ